MTPGNRLSRRDRRAANTRTILDRVRGTAHEWEKLFAILNAAADFDEDGRHRYEGLIDKVLIAIRIDQITAEKRAELRIAAGEVYLCRQCVHRQFRLGPAGKMLPPCARFPGKLQEARNACQGKAWMPNEVPRAWPSSK